MDKLKSSTAAKLGAFILSVVMAGIFIVSSVSVVIMGYYKFYFSDEETVTTEILTDMANREIYNLENKFESGMDLQKYYSDKNIFYSVTDVTYGVEADSNYNGEEYFAAVEDTYITETSYNVDDKEALDLKEELVYYSDDKVILRQQYDVKLYVARNMRHNDLFSVALKTAQFGFKLKYTAILILLVSLALDVVLICFLFCSAGHTKDGSVRLNYFDKIPFDILSVLVFAGFAAELFYILDIEFSLLTVIAVFVDYIVFLIYFLSFATRVKTGTVFKNTVIVRLLKLLYKALKNPLQKLWFTIKGLGILGKTALLLSVAIIGEILTVLLAVDLVSVGMESAVIIPIVYNLLSVAFILYAAVCLKRIKIGGERIASGDFEYKIDTKNMIGDFKAFAESLNNISNGLQSAIDEKVKSEHFKTELITNVSHDIKTPLTSIINYVDLLSKEKIDNKAAIEYIEVLSRQSSRLKKLIEDLVEASKASSGALAVNRSDCDIGVLLSQTVGEFEEKLQKTGVKAIVTLPDKPIRVYADGRHLWRVFENLMSNICKYSMPDTRVYIEADSIDGKAVIKFKNISKYELNISADELLERFVRGDKSRNTEGSGLGLSIANSLTALQGGKLELSIDGDLFKASVIFDEVEK